MSGAVCHPLGRTMPLCSPAHARHRHCEKMPPSLGPSVLLCPVLYILLEQPAPSLDSSEFQKILSDHPGLCLPTWFCHTVAAGDTQAPLGVVS